MLADKDFVLADKDFGEAETGHDAVEDKGARADHIHPSGMHGRDGRPFCWGHGKQPAGNLMYSRGGIRACWILAES